ncbi:MAG: TIGR00730 family Rossman fold protein [Acidimicrobiales bacterium]
MTPAPKPTRRGTGDAEIDLALARLLDDLGADHDRDLLLDIFVSAAGLASDGADRLDLKITSAALREMRAAFRAFAPYKATPKVTIFGSARTGPTDPTYDQAKDLARLLAEKGWMVVTGAGPGIMAAGMEGAGREHSFGVNIRLPHEEGANEFIRGDDKLVSMKYFFTRKLMLIKESKAFVSLPGGFGTLDETFELLTLLQTGKAEPAPIVLLDRPGGTFWDAFVRFVHDEVMPRGLVDDHDLDLVLVTDDVSVACDELVTFARNYRSMRWVGKILVVRVAHPPTDAELTELDREFGSLSLDGHVRRSEPLPAEVADGDGVDLARVTLRYDGFQAGRLRRLINALNTLASLG